MSSLVSRISRSFTGIARTAVFFLKVFPMLPSRPVDWVTKTPLIEKVKYPTRDGIVEGEVYRPSSGGPYPSIVVCLGVVPFGVDHPQVPVLGRALARAGFIALLYWSPAMRKFQISTEDVENIALAYDWLIQQPNVDPERSGLLGTCVGGSFALMAASQPLIQKRISFIGAYAPFSSMWIFARDIASGTRSGISEREPWLVDQLTHRVFIHSLAAWLPEEEADWFIDSFIPRGTEHNHRVLSADGQAVYGLLTATNEAEAETALNYLPEKMKDYLVYLSPINHLEGLHVPLIVLLHDRGDQVIPVGESRRLFSALSAHNGVHFTEMQFSHLDPTKGKLPFPRLVRELIKFFFAVYPLFK